MKDDVWSKAIFSLNDDRPTFSLQNHFPQVLLAHLMTQLLFLMPQNEQACGGSSYSNDWLDDLSDYSSDSDLACCLNMPDNY